MKRLTKLAAVALVIGAVGAVLARLKRPSETAALPSDERTEELRRKLAEARAAAADQDDFEAAGMGAETIVEEPPRAEPGKPEQPETAPDGPEAEEPQEAQADAEVEATPEPDPEPTAEEAPDAAKEAAPPATLPPSEPPQDEFEAMRRRIHQEGKAAAEEMRRSADSPEKP